jgi:hypothetical protein
VITTIQSVLPGLYYRVSPTRRNQTKPGRHRRPHVACATSVPARLATRLLSPGAEPTLYR